MKRDLSGGFTIVELLIVIVIISILATLVIVSYNGITQRANNTQTIDTTKQYINAIILYAQDNGDYPRTTDASVATNACLGVGYPAGKCADTGSVLAGGIGNAFESAAFNAKISIYTNGKFTLPSLQQVMWNGQLFVGTAYWYSAGGTAPVVHYILAGDVSCGSLSGGTTAKLLDSGNTHCNWVPPTL